ncbi:MAG: lysoplasmalogenase [Chitinophagales bacterium]
MKLKALYIFLLVAVAEVTAEIIGHEVLRFIFKPLLMITLVGFYYQQVAGQWNRAHKLMVAAFFFSWVGDVSLMLVFKNENLFLAGLVSFLITHLLYTFAFNRVDLRDKEPLLPKQIWKITPLMVYMAVLFYFLIPGISGNEKTNPLLVPVIVYAVAIANMVAFAVNRYGRVNDDSFKLVFAGALLFMFSDSIIAINKFLHPFPTASIFIMALYITGQYLIAQGMLSQFNRKAEW